MQGDGEKLVKSAQHHTHRGERFSHCRVLPAPLISLLNPHRNMATTEQVNRVSTGVPGLDDILRGGLVANRLYLVDGAPGAGKTTLSLQFLREGVKRGEKGLYITLAESEAELRAVARSHGWTLDGVEVYEMPSVHGAGGEQNSYTLFHPAEIELANSAQSIAKQVELARPNRVVIDSLSELRLIAQDPLRYRRQLLALKQFFSRYGCTTLVLDDLTAEPSNRLLTIAHGVVHLEAVEMAFGPRRRRLEVIKMRELPFQGGYHDYEIRTGGLEVFPRLVAADYGKEFKQGYFSSGIPDLDQMLGGGVHTGTSTVITGPAGAGKTTLTSQYALAAAERGMKSAIYIFDERLPTFLTRAEGLNMPIREHLEAGRIKVVQVDPAEMSPGEFAWAVRRSVEEGAEVVVIDSLTGYLHAMPDQRFLLLQMHELLTYLNQQGVVSMLVVAQAGLTTLQLESPIDLSYLVDTVILLKYYERQGEIRRLINVFKKRPGGHETFSREMQMGPDRFNVGDRVTHIRNLLAAIPQHGGSQETDHGPAGV